MENKLKVLYIDDEPINIMLFENIFKRKYIIKTAESGFEGLELLQENQDIRVVISDMNMPGMTGLEFIQKAKAIYPDISFYILTGYDITKEIMEALNEGLIDRYFKKPFNMKEIDSTINESLGQ